MLSWNVSASAIALWLAAGCVPISSNLRTSFARAVAAGALFPRIEHASVVLIGGDDFVAGLQIDTELRDLQRFACVSRDRHLFGIAPEFRGEAPSHGLDVRFEDLPHVIDRRLVGDV